ncbi:MAG: DUF366 family protein [Pseudomonadota bacterium]
MARTFLEARYINKPINYDGSQLSPNWIYQSFGIMGDAAVAFIGACDITESMVDVEDVIAGSEIRADKMLHFIIELFGRDCVFSAAIQSVLVGEIQSELLRHGAKVVKAGDDLFVGKGKLSISIATASAVSGLIHIGLNITNSGTPVKTSALKDLGINQKKFAVSILRRFNKEYSRIILAAAKVRPR